MKEQYGNRKLGLVAFDNIIDVIGDGTQQIHQLHGDVLYDPNWLINNGIEEERQRM